jgi:uncharacterized protein (TIGR01777 family)
MKIILAGGSGQVGTFVANAFHSKGDEVVVLSRSQSKQAWKTVTWDAINQGDWSTEIQDAEVVINLAGRSVNCRYNPENRRQILESRTLSTLAIGKAIEDAPDPPRLWINASTATIYTHRFDATNDEFTGLVGVEEAMPDTWKFSYDVGVQWEDAMERYSLPRTRKIKARMAMVMGSGKDSVFDVLTGLASKGLGGTLGNGKQYVSWIHEVDFLRAIQWLIEKDTLAGPVNFCSPNPIPNKEFMKIIRKVTKMPFGLPALNWMLEIGAIFLQTETELLLKSRRVIPGKLLKDGFQFKYPEWKVAAEEIRKRQQLEIGFEPQMLS